MVRILRSFSRGKEKKRKGKRMRKKKFIRRVTSRLSRGKNKNLKMIIKILIEEVREISTERVKKAERRK